MNKKGFTLVEIIVSISLVSVVLVYLLATLVKLREVYSTVNDDTDVKIIGSSISRVINNDIKDNCGIKTAVCTSKTSCTIEFNSGQKRILTLRSEDLTEDLIIKESNEDEILKAEKITTHTTVEYKNTTTNSKILTKTLSSIKEETQTMKDEKVYDEIRTKHYHMTGLSINSYSYNTAKGTIENIYVITIQMSDKKYDLNLYANSI